MVKKLNEHGQNLKVSKTASLCSFIYMLKSFKNYSAADKAFITNQKTGGDKLDASDVSPSVTKI